MKQNFLPVLRGNGTSLKLSFEYVIVLILWKVLLWLSGFQPGYFRVTWGALKEMQMPRPRQNQSESTRWHLSFIAASAPELQFLPVSSSPMLRNTP